MAKYSLLFASSNYAVVVKAVGVCELKLSLSIAALWLLCVLPHDLSKEFLQFEINMVQSREH